MFGVWGGKSRFVLVVLMSFVGAFSFFSVANAAVGINKQINFQGKVVNSDGTNVTNGSYTFLFCLYTTGSPSIACTSGANNDAVWRESKSVTVTDGVFQTALGDTTTFPGSVDFNSDNIYLGINFNSNGQMTPLIQFTAAPYAFNADKIHGLSVTDTTGTLTIPSGKTIAFSDAFSTTGAFPLTLTATASTTATLPSGTITLVDLATSQSLTNKTIGSTGLTFSGAATDITTASGEDLVLVASGAGVISLSDSVTVTNALAANGGITFDASTDTVGAHTLAGTIDASTNILTNIGNTGTDFVASTGALTLAGVLTANGGISLSASQSLSAVALSFVDLGLITQSSTANQGLRLPNAASATPSNPTSGEGYLAWDAAGNQLITYNGSAWTTVGGSIAADSLDFTDLKDAMVLDVSTDFKAPNGQAYVFSVTNDGTGNSFVVNDVASDTTPFVIDPTGNVGVGTSTFDGTNPEKLLVDAGTTSSINVISAKGTINNYLQLNIQNKSTGTGASSDLVATADNGSETTYYIDMGINGSAYTGGVFGAANDAYLYNIGQNMYIGTGTAAKSLSFVTGGTAVSTKERAKIDGNGNFLLTGGDLTYTNNVGLINVANTTNYTGVASQNAYGFQVKPVFTLTEPASGNFIQYGASIDMSGITVTAGAGTSEVSGLRIFGTSDADIAIVEGMSIENLTSTAASETAINIGTGWDTIIGGTTAGTNLLSFTNFSVTTAGAVTAAAAIAANGGITFDASTDTIGAHTLAGTIDASTNILTNIGNAGTDFIASTGALNLAGVLTANGGISLSASQSLSAVALSFVDLGLITQSSTANQGLRLPNAASATPSNPTSGEGYLAWDAAGNQLITYNGSAWTTVGGGGYNLIKNETTGLTARTTLAFLGAGVDCADNGGQTECTIAGGSGSDLQTTYDTDANGSNATISLTAADDSIVISNPASSGTDSTFTMKVEQLAAGAIDGLQITNAGTGTGLKINTTSTGSLAVFQNNGVDKVTFANNGSLTINGADSSITRHNTADFALGTVGSNLTNSNGKVQLSDGTPANSGQGTITTSSQPATPSNIGAGAMSITRPDGKVLIINGGSTGTTQLYDPLAPVATAITASQTITCNGTTTVGIGAIALPRPNGLYTLICGVSGSLVGATSTIDPMGNIGSRLGPPLITTPVTGAGTVAYKRPDGKFLVTVGASSAGNATQIYDPVADSFAAGPAAASGNWTTGALAIPMPDGRALIVNGGSTSTTNIYNPNGVSATIGTFTVGPSLDGVKAATTCGINGAGSVALKRQDGKFVILSKANVRALFDPSAMTMTCDTTTNVTALGDGAHAIPLQNGKFLIFAGGNTTTAFVYNQDTDTFSTYTGTAPTAITTGAHSLMRLDGTWQIITGTNTCTNGCTNNFSTGLPMSDPFPSMPVAGTPTSSGACTAGLHSYYVTFVTNSVESELGQKSNIVSCTASNGTVALSSIPLGPPGTSARKIYRTTAGDASVPKLLNTTGSCSTAGSGSGITDNTTTSCSDTTADGSLGADYAVTAATTWYTSEDISNASLGVASTIRWTAQLEAVYAAMRNNVTNTAYKTMQFYVKTAVNNSGCATPLAAASWREIQNSGDSIRAVSGANCIKVAVHFNRAMPKKLYDERGTWIGNGSTVLRLDYTTPTIFDYAIDNSAVVKRSTWDFTDVTSAIPMAPTVPTAPTSNATSGTSGACTNGAHFWFVTYMIDGAESNLSPASSSQTCSGGNQTEGLTNVPIGPSGTTARKIYRTAAGYLVTDTPFLVGTISDNSTTTYSDGLADASLGAAYIRMTPSGPTLSRAEGSRVESSNNQLSLPWGRITPTTLSTSAAGVGQAYMGVFGSDHPSLNNPAGMGTFVIARDDKTFLVVEGGGATADLYDPATQTFTNQTAAGDKPTATVGTGAFAIKRPDGKYLVILGNNTTTTNIYDQYAPSGSRFTLGPTLTGTAANQGAFSVLNADGTWTILPGNTGVTTSIYDPVRNTMTVGPLQTTGTNYGGLAIPLMGPNSNIYKIIVGSTLGGAVVATTMNYNGNTKIFTAGQALAVGVGSGAFAFQRQDGYWILVKGESAANTLGAANSIINPYTGAETTSSTTLSASVAGRGSHVIPRADGTFLVIGGNVAPSATVGSGLSVLTQIYFPWGGAFNVAGGTQEGKWAAGPTMAFQGTQSTAPAALTTAAPASGGANLCDTGTHMWRYTQVIDGVETALSTAGTQQTCTVTTLGQEALTGIAAGPAGTTARKVYRTKAGTTSPYFYVGTVAGNITTTYNDSAADSSLTIQYWSGGPADGAVSFQRPDGKFVTLFGGTAPGSTTVNVYDAGWYADGQYLSEQMQVPAMAANSTLEWQQTPDQFVRMAVRTAASQTALGAAGYTAISNPGGSIGNAANDTWAQVQVNFRRDFPTFGLNQNGVYVSSGGMTYLYRNVSLPTVNSFQITNGMDLMSLQNNGLNVFRVTSNGSILSSTQGGFYSGGADLAENYTSTQMLEKGEVVMIDQANPEAVLRATGQYHNNILGVVSTTPGFVAGGYTETSYPIALVGRVPVKVSTENGSIAAGDTLTSASIPGYAMKATMAGRTLGRALEAFDSADAVPCPSQGLGNNPETKCGSIMMFVNLANYYGSPVDVVMAEQKPDLTGVDGLDMQEEGAHEQNGLEIPSSMRLVVSAPAQERQTLAYLLKLRDERSGGRLLPTSEVFTDRVAASTSVITPTLVADRIFAKSIKADSIEGLEVYTNKIGSLEEKYATLSNTPAPNTLLNTQAMATYFAVMMKNIAVETLVVKLDGSILGKLTVGGDAQFGGKSTFAELASFLGVTNFEGQVNFESVPTFSSNMGGFAVITEGQQSVVILFDQAYDMQPIVSVSLTNELSPLATDAQKDQDLAQDIEAVDQDMTEAYFDEDIRYLVTKKSKHGFTILLNKKAPRELKFSWVALAVKEGKTFHSEIVKESRGDVKNKIATPVEKTIPISEVSPSDSIVDPVEGDASVRDVLIDSPLISEPEAPSE